MPKLNQEQLFAFELRFPSLKLQRTIVEHLDAVQLKLEELRKAQAETAAELAALLPAVLAKAFAGEL